MTALAPSLKSIFINRRHRHNDFTLFFRRKCRRNTCISFLLSHPHPFFATQFLRTKRVISTCFTFICIRINEIAIQKLIGIEMLCSQRYCYADFHVIVFFLRFPSFFYCSTIQQSVSSMVLFSRDFVAFRSASLSTNCFASPLLQK